MSSNYTTFAFDRAAPRNVKFSPNAGNQSHVSEGCAPCSSFLEDPDDSLSAQCRRFGAQFCLIAGNAKTALYVHLRNVRCKEGISEDDPSTWVPVNIAGYKFITLYARKMNDHSEKFILHGYPVAPLHAGNVVFLFHPGVLDCIGGEYEGEVEIEYKDGHIITAIEWVKFIIVEDFSGHGAAADNPDCDSAPDHHPGVPGVQFPIVPEQLPEHGIAQLPEQGDLPIPLTALVPAAVTEVEGVNDQMRAVLKRHGVIR